MTSTERRRALAAAVFSEAFSLQEFDELDPALDSYVLNVRGRRVELGRGDLQRIVAAWHDAFSNFRFDVHRVVVDGDVAAVHATLRGTQTGEWNGRPPTGKAYEAEHMCFIRFEGEQIREVWELYDTADLP